MTKGIKQLIVPDGEFYKSVFRVAAPIALQSLITIGVNMLDTIMVGALGEQELSAASLANQFINIYHILCMGIGMGASVLIARYWGMREQELEQAKTALKKTVCLMMRFTLGLAAVFALLTWLLPGKIMKMYTPETGVIQLGATYFRYSVLTYFFLGLSLVSTLVLRCVGQVKLPLFVSMGAFLVNLAANYALIFGRMGMPKMGIAGAALGTLTARIFETGVICGYLFWKDDKIGFRLRNLGMDTGDLLREYVRISIPVLISDGILAIGGSAAAMVIGHLGVTFVAANAVTGVTQQMSTVVIQGIAQAGAIVTGQTLGRGEKQKAWNQGYGFLGLGIFLGLLSGVFIIMVKGTVINAYQLTPETAKTTLDLMNAISLIIVFQAANSIMTKGVLRGGGDTRTLMIADNIFLWLISLPLGMLAGFVFRLSAFWVYFFLKFDQVAKTIWCVLRLNSGKWIQKISVR